jgi:hypothetical protein
VRTQFNISEEPRHWCPRDLHILVEAADGTWFCPSEECDFVGSVDEGLQAIA